MSLLDHRDNVYSRYGEVGIIQAIFDTIGDESRWCCEFGAWDGIHLSNTRRLVETGWHAVLIEGDEDKFHCNAGRVLGYQFNSPRLTHEALGLPRRRLDLRMHAMAVIWWLSRRESPRLQRVLRAIGSVRG